MRSIMSISIPPDLYKRIKERKGANFSAVCQKAIEKHLDYLDGIESGRLPSVRTLVTQIHNAVCLRAVCLASDDKDDQEKPKKANKKKATSNGKPTRKTGRRSKAVLPLR